MTAVLKQEILKHIKSYGTGRDTLRCLALATVDNPPKKEDMNMEDATKFIQYEVGNRCARRERCYTDIYSLQAV